MDRIPAFETIDDLVRETIRTKANKGMSLNDMIGEALPEHRSLLAKVLTPTYLEEVSKN